MVLNVNINPFESMAALIYLGWTVTYNNTDSEELYANLSKAQKHWVVVLKVLGQMGVHVKARSVIYKSVFQTVLFHGYKIWVVTYAMMTVTEGFHQMLD